jgi:hypothetical protein
VRFQVLLHERINYEM